MIVRQSSVKPPRVALIYKCTLKLLAEVAIITSGPVRLVTTTPQGTPIIQGTNGIIADMSNVQSHLWHHYHVYGNNNGRLLPPVVLSNTPRRRPWALALPASYHTYIPILPSACMQAPTCIQAQPDAARLSNSHCHQSWCLSQAPGDMCTHALRSQRHLAKAWAAQHTCQHH